jgi:hypothetical protein
MASFIKRCIQTREKTTARRNDETDEIEGQ